MSTSTGTRPRCWCRSACWIRPAFPWLASSRRRRSWPPARCPPTRCWATAGPAPPSRAGGRAHGGCAHGGCTLGGGAFGRRRLRLRPPVSRDSRIPAGPDLGQLGDQAVADRRERGDLIILRAVADPHAGHGPAVLLDEVAEGGVPPPRILPVEPDERRRAAELLAGMQVMRAQVRIQQGA